MRCRSIDQGRKKENKHYYEEQVKVLADPPTTRKNTLHLPLTITATGGWNIKNACIQDENWDRDVIKLPSEHKENIIYLDKTEERTILEEEELVNETTLDQVNYGQNGLKATALRDRDVVVATAKLIAQIILLKDCRQLKYGRLPRQIPSKDQQDARNAEDGFVEGEEVGIRQQVEALGEQREWINWY